ncbi:histidine phosphatase family protein [Nocardioides terrisoli]|uniref:histidine phosphatase family protein n=1 Tax=Nocardioides terrisoli TaxID=3388267 RepID=UPI00287BB632|nr:histidine phosphatase family protein [Nocardioides marmorisolisilvae]
MSIVILARHGRTEANATGLLAGRTPGVRLDERGRDQARAAADRLAGLPLATVVTSPLERCRETARLLVGDRGLRVRPDKRLTECDYGEWTAQKLSELARKPLWKVVQGQPSAARFPGGESLPEVSARAIAAIRDRDTAVAAEHGDGAVWLAVSHGDVIKAVLADALGMHLDQFQRIVVDPASLSVVRYTSGRTFVLTMNSTSGSLEHLRPAPRGHSRGRHRPRADAALGGGTGTGEHTS